MNPALLSTAAAGAALLTWGGSGWLNRELAPAFAEPAVIRTLAADAYLWGAATVVVCAPLVGVASRRSRTAGFGAAAAFTAASLAFALTAAFFSGSSWRPVWVSHVVVAVVGLTLVALGQAAAQRIPSLVDAAGVSLALSLGASAVLLVGGPATAELGEQAINAGLLANPLIAMTAAADIDLLRTPVLYDLAPISHRRFSYPSWQVTTLAYGALAACAFSLSLKGSRC